MRPAYALARILACIAALTATILPGPVANATTITSVPPYRSYDPYPLQGRPPSIEHARVVLTGVPNDIIPKNSNKWNCSCDTDGCWPGCFTIASATILKYWSQKGYPNLWNGDENGTLIRLRELFPNMLCYGNGNNNGKPGDTGYDAFDVASGLHQFILEHGYQFTLQAIPNPTFEQVMAEIDAGRPIIGAFAASPWGSHAGTIVGYDTTGSRQVMIVRPNLWQKVDTDLEWGHGYQGFGLVTIVPGGTSGDGHVSGPTAPQVTYQVVVNLNESGFTAQGAWQTVAGVGKNGQALALMTTDPSNLGPTDDTGWARWNPQLPYDGEWEVLAWVPLVDTDDTATHNATYRITHAEGMSLIRRSQHDAAQGWMSLGDFPFVRGDKAVVRLGNLTGDNPPRRVWADAIKFVWRAPLIVQSEDGDGGIYLVQNGKRQRIPDMDTFHALRLSRSNIRILSPLQLAQYPLGDPLPSIFGGWIGQYYNNTVLSAPASLIRYDNSLNFQWNGSAPAANMSTLGFSVRWSRVLALGDGHYPFVINAVGGVRLYVDGHLEMNDWEANNVYVQHSRIISMTSGLHRVEVEYTNSMGHARISLADLPPNAPIVPDVSPPEGGSAVGSSVSWTNSPTITLRWQDGGDPNGTDRPHRYYASVWRASDGWTINSGWITATEWSPPLAADGRYFWRVSAGDGTAVSDWSPPHEIDVDRTPPWSQMMSAHSGSAAAASIMPASAMTQPARLAPATQMPNAVRIDASGQPISDSVVPTTVVPASVAAPAQHLGVSLTWWATDTQSGIASFDVQARELIHALTRYTPTVETRQATRIGYELTVSGSQEITTAVVITSLVPYTTVTPILVYVPVTPTQWLTFATGVVTTQTLFIGNPGSTYEFRVRAHDKAGNTQDWLDGYSVKAQVDPNITVWRTFIPLVGR